MLKQIKKFIKLQCNKFTKLYENITMQKCPNCQQKGFENNIIEKKFLRETTTYIDDNSHSSPILDSHYRTSNINNLSNEREVKVNVYNVKYLCKHCNFIIEQEINDERNYGDLKILMPYSEYKKLPKE